MKFIHIASFKGNSGDIFNHKGFYKITGLDKCDIEQIEIRKFYKNCQELMFDDDLVKKINQTDGLILGGGEFFDVRWNYSATGTTLDFNVDFLNNINVPVLVNAMGMSYEKTEKEAIEKFITFIEKIADNRKWMLTIRNDGSYENMKQLFDERIMNNIVEVPDNGFLFAEPKGVEDDCVGFLITNDLFNEEFNHGVTPEVFNDEIAKVIESVLLKGEKVMLFAHAPQDIGTVHMIYSKLSTSYFRERISIAPYEPNSIDGAERIVNYYRRCKLVVSMRFHGCVLPIQIGVPTIGLAGHSQILQLFQKLESLEEQCVVVGEEQYIEKLQTKIKETLDNSKKIIDKQQIEMQKIICESKKYGEIVSKYFHLNE